MDPSYPIQPGDAIRMTWPVDTGTYGLLRPGLKGKVLAWTGRFSFNVRWADGREGRIFRGFVEKEA